MASLVAVWGARLTYNFARKGGYRAGEQDYLMARVAWIGDPTKPGGVANPGVSFMAYQHALLLLISAGPMSVAFAMRGNQPNLTGADLVATGCFVAFLALEAAADQQQWRFQQAKREVAARARRRARTITRAGS